MLLVQYLQVEDLPDIVLQVLLDGHHERRDLLVLEVHRIVEEVGPGLELLGHSQAGKVSNFSCCR